MADSASNSTRLRCASNTSIALGTRLWCCRTSSTALVLALFSSRCSQVRQDNVTGLITVNKPDFEFANFTVNELAEVAAQLDETEGYSGDTIRNADWQDVACGNAFEQQYRRVSARQPFSSKGKKWGEALAKYAMEHQSRADTGVERSFIREIRAALYARNSIYDFRKERCTLILKHSRLSLVHRVPRTGEARF